MSHRTRKLVAILVLVLALPAYILVAAMIVSSFGRPSVAVEIAIYIILGVIWALPLRRLFLGIAREDPDRESDGPR